MSLPSKPQRYRLMLSGVVQGVGLRPFIYNQAKALALCGFVANDGSGVLIEVEGDLIGMQTFVALLKNAAPPLAFIEHLEVTTITPLGCDEFIIKTSRHNSVQTLISPDIAVCEKCLKEFNDPQNRRYHYPFINCTDCGPRFSTVHSLPFDRHHTAMHAFKPCKKCLYEYEDPDDRRFHAQTISCPDCGPKITLRDHQGRHLADENEAIDMVCRMIEDGSIVAVKGWGGFHILCDANNDDAVSKLRRKKRRPSKPLAVMFPDMRSVKKHTLLTPKEEQLLTSKEHPILLVKAKSTMPISKKVTCGITKVGLFLPYTPLHHRILKKLQRPVVATSANISEEPILTKEQEVLQRLSHLVSAVLSHDLPIINACDDSVMMIAHDHPMTLRAARGIAPYSFTLPHTNTKNILAVGGHHKSSIAFSVGSHLIVSPHIGDLDSLETFAYWKRTLKRLSQLYNFKLDLIVHDQHPAYETTKWALDQKSGTLSVQHHYAHALSCMAEYQLQTKVLAFCFDGTGYGNIQNSNISGADTIAPLKILGSEIMIADTHNYERLMNLKPSRAYRRTGSSGSESA